MRAQWSIPLILGGVLGFVSPNTEGISSIVYIARMLPASGGNSQSVVLTCGFHGGSCYSNTNGDFLDWDNSSTTNSVYFRGIFVRANSPMEDNRLYAKRRTVASGSAVCDNQEVRIYDRESNVLRGVMHYYHISSSGSADFPISTSGTGVFFTKNIGTMINDNGGSCQFNGTHVHAGFGTLPIAASKSKNTMFPTRNYCPNNSTCRSYRNDQGANWTHKFTWSVN